MNILCVTGSMVIGVPSLATGKAQALAEGGPALCIGVSQNSSLSLPNHSFFSQAKILLFRHSFSYDPPRLGCFFGLPLWLPNHLCSRIFCLDLLCSLLHNHKFILSPSASLASLNLSMGSIGEVAERVFNVLYVYVVVCGCVCVSACTCV